MSGPTEWRTYNSSMEGYTFVGNSTYTFQFVLFFTQFKVHYINKTLPSSKVNFKFDI